MIRPDLAAIPAYVPGKTDPEALKLSSNEVAGVPLPAAAKAMAEAAAGGNRYPDMGAAALKNALARHLGVGAENVAVGCGSSALCQQLAQATSTPDNNIIFPWRSFEAYPIFCRITGAEPRPVPLIDGARETLRDGFVPGGSKRNLDWVRPHVDSDRGEEELLLLADAQTSGGLLLIGEIPGYPVIGETTAGTGRVRVV